MRLLSGTRFVPIVAAFLLSCTDDPNPVGGSLLPATDQPVMKVDTVYASSHSVSRDILDNSGALRIMVGKNQFYEAWALIKFTLPDSLVNAVITDAKITLRSGYYFGDTLAALSFVAYRGKRSWFGDSLTVDSLKLGDYFDAAVSAAFSAVVGDTDNVQFSIDTGMVRQWFANIPDTNQVNHGVILQPTNSGIIKGFKSFNTLNPEDHRPKLTIQYTKTGVSGTAAIIDGSYKYVADIGRVNLVQNPDRIYVQAGVAYNGYINFISTSPVPARASVHKAELEVVLDSSLTRLNKYSVDSLAAYYVGPTGVDFFIQAAVSDTVMISGKKVYRFQIQQYMQRWVRGAAAGLALFTYSEADVMDLFTFYGWTASKELRPRIIVTYSPTQ